MCITHKEYYSPASYSQPKLKPTLGGGGGGGGVLIMEVYGNHLHAGSSGENV